MQTARAELGHRLACLQAFEGAVRDHVVAHGFWCNAVDPRTGHAMHGSAGARYSEAVGAQIFCGYQVQSDSMISAVQHPAHGVHTYPATIFTTASLSSIQTAVHAACAVDSAQLQAQAAPPGQRSPDTALLDVQAVTVSGAGGAHLAVRPTCAAGNVTFAVLPGQRVVLRGPPGVGKSTFVNALRGLSPLHSGHIAWAPSMRAMHVPQDAVLAPCSTLREQLQYPEGGSCDAAEASSLLQAVGLMHLWHRYDGAAGGLNDTSGQDAAACHSADAHAAWSAATMSMSAGEVQCLCIARVLRAKPDIVLLDEAFSAVPPQVERKLLSLLQDAGVAVLMVSHREESLNGADGVLLMQQDMVPDGWVFETPAK